VRRKTGLGYTSLLLPPLENYKKVSGQNRRPGSPEKAGFTFKEKGAGWEKWRGEKKNSVF